MQSSEDFDAGSTLLWLLEDFALNNHNASHPRVESNNISKNVHNIDILLQTNYYIPYESAHDQWVAVQIGTLYNKALLQQERSY